MSVTEILIKVIGLVLAIFGLLMIINSATALPAAWITALVGLVCLVVGIYIIKGGVLTL